MNKNTRARFEAAKSNRRAGNKQSTFVIPKVLSGVGEGSSWGEYGKRVFNFEAQPRLSTKAKVGGKNHRAPRSKDESDV